jgi:O-antigen/teichoic acid export membrane protein
MEDSLKKRYTIKLFANIVGAVIGIFIVAIVPKALGPISYGHFAYLQNFFMQMIGFLDMGSSIAFFTKLSARVNRKELIVFYALYSIAVLTVASLLIILTRFFYQVQNIFPGIPDEYIFMGLFYGFSVWLTQIFIKISDAHALTVSVELIKIGHKILSLLLLLYLVYFTAFDLKIYFYFQYIALISFLIILGWLFYKKGIIERRIFQFGFGFNNILKEFIDYCNPLVIYNIVGVLVGIFDIWLLQKMAGSEQTGFYGLALSLVTICFLFTSAMTPVITREFSKLYEENDLERMKKIFSKYIPMLYAISAYIGVFVAFQSDNIISIFTDERFENASVVLMVMAFYPMHQTYGQLSGSVFYATGQTRLYRNIGIIGMSIGLLITFFLIYVMKLGALGLAWKLILAQLIGVIIQLYFNSKFLKFSFRNILWHQVYSVIFFVFLAYISTKVLYFDSSLVTFLVSGVLYTALVIVFTYIFPKVFVTNRKEIRKYINIIVAKVLCRRV